TLSSGVSFGGNLKDQGGVNYGVRGNLTIAVSGSTLSLASTSTYTLTVGGNLNLTAGTFIILTGGGNSTLNVKGSIDITGGIMQVANSTSSVSTINVDNDFKIETAGEMQFGTANVATAANNVINIGRDFLVSGTGGVYKTGSGK